MIDPIFENIFDDHEQNISYRDESTYRVNSLSELPRFEHSLTVKLFNSTLFNALHKRENDFRIFMNKMLTGLMYVMFDQTLFDDFFIVTFNEQAKNIYNITVYESECDYIEIADAVLDDFGKEVTFDQKNQKHMYVSFCFSCSGQDKVSYQKLYRFCKRIVDNNTNCTLSGFRHLIDKIRPGSDKLSDDKDFKYYNKHIQQLYSSMYPEDMIEKHSIIGADMHYNGPVRLSKQSEKRVKDFQPLELLFVTETGELVSQSHDESGEMNRPVAIYVGNSRFCSVCALSLKNPDRGTMCTDERFYNFIPNYGFHNMVLSKLYKGQLETGEDMFRFGLDILNKQNTEPNWKSGPLLGYSIHNQSQTDGCSSPLFISAWRFRPKGTRRGDWYLPSVKEVKKLRELCSDLKFEIRDDYKPYFPDKSDLNFLMEIILYYYPYSSFDYGKILCNYTVEDMTKMSCKTVTTGGSSTTIEESRVCKQSYDEDHPNKIKDMNKFAVAVPFIHVID